MHVNLGIWEGLVFPQAVVFLAVINDDCGLDLYPVGVLLIYSTASFDAILLVIFMARVSSRRLYICIKKYFF